MAGVDGLPTEKEVAEALCELPQDSFVRAYCRWAAANTAAPLIFHVNVALALLAVQAHDDFAVEYGGQFRLVWWAMLVGGAGDTYKSTSVFYGVDTLTPVAPQRLALDAGSWEGLLEMLALEPRQLMVHDDFEDFLKRTRGNGYQAPIRSKYLQLWNCRRVSRKLTSKKQGGADEVVQEQPRASFLVGVTPDQIEGNTDDSDWSGNGFASRWCITAGVRERPAFTLPGGRLPDARQWLVDRIGGIGDLTPTPCAGLTDDALRLLEGLKGWLAKKQADAPRLVRGTYSRANALAVRAAALLSLDCGEAGRASCWRIGTREMRFAIRLVGWHLRGVDFLSDFICSNDYQRKRRKVLDCLPENGGVVQRSEIARKCRYSPRDLRDVLEGLQEERTIVLCSSSNGTEQTYCRNVPGAGELAAHAAADSGEKRETQEPAEETTDTPA